MTVLFSTFAEALRRRARYVRTRDEIARLPDDIAIDLGIYRGDAASLARKAVYGA